MFLYQQCHRHAINIVATMSISKRAIWISNIISTKLSNWEWNMEEIIINYSIDFNFIKSFTKLPFNHSWWIGRLVEIVKCRWRFNIVRNFKRNLFRIWMFQFNYLLHMAPLFSIYCPQCQAEEETGGAMVGLGIWDRALNGS